MAIQKNILLLLFIVLSSLTQEKTFQERYVAFQATPEYQDTPPLVIAAIKEDIPGISHFATGASFDDLLRAKEILKTKIDILHENLNYVPPRDTRESVERAMDRDQIKHTIHELQGAMDMVVRALEKIAARS